MKRRLGKGVSGLSKDVIGGKEREGRFGGEGKFCGGSKLGGCGGVRKEEVGFWVVGRDVGGLVDIGLLRSSNHSKGRLRFQ